MLREIVEERKEKAVETLTTSYAKNRLPLEEYERLVEYINKIESERELAVVEKIVAEYDVGDSKPSRADDDDEDDSVQDEYYSDDQSHGNFPNLAIFATRSLSGKIKSGSQFVSIMGSQHIKIRKSDLTKKKTVLEVVSIFGENVIFVEPGIHVSNRAIPIFGVADVERKIRKNNTETERELVISGAALFGNVTVKQLKE